MSKKQPRRIVRLKFKGTKKLSKDERNRLKKVIKDLDDAGVDFEIDGEFSPEPNVSSDVLDAANHNLKVARKEASSHQDEDAGLGVNQELKAVTDQFLVDQRRARVVASKGTVKRIVVFLQKIQVGAVVRWVAEALSSP